MARRKPKPEHLKTKQELAREATTWQQWFDAQPEVSRYGAVVYPLPWALNWQHNPAAPIPPGYVWVRCRCLVTICRPPSWRSRDARGREHRPAFTVGMTCDNCGWRYVQIPYRDCPYDAAIRVDGRPTIPAPRAPRSPQP